MADIVCVRVDWDRQCVPLRLSRYHAVHVLPEPDYPLGRKGRVLAGAWRQLSAGKADGMLILDGDVVIDPLDHALMLRAVHSEPEAVHVAPVRLWPVSTHLRTWVWGHGVGAYSQEETDDPDIFTFGFTFLPRALIEACIVGGLEEWAYPGVDASVSRVAREQGTPVRVLWEARPVHLNY